MWPATRRRTSRPRITAPTRYDDGVPEAERGDPRRAVGQQRRDDHHDDADDARHDRHERGPAAVTERVVRPREQQERAVREQSDRERSERGRQQLDPGAVSATERDRRASLAMRARP